MQFIPQMKPHFDHIEATKCQEYINSGGFLTEYVKTTELEQMIAKFTGSNHCIMVNNGTVSLSIALLAIGIKPNDEIIIPDLTMVATANAVILLGAVPVFVDVDGFGELKCVERAITPNTKAVIHVSLNGQCRNIYEIKDFCVKNRLFLIEDAAQSLGSFHDNKHVGTFGDIGSFSFSTPKIISTGQGGALITNNDLLAKKIKQIKDFGRQQGGTDEIAGFGINAKFTDLQAVIGIEQMKKLPGRILRKRHIWNQYREQLSDIKEIEFLHSNINLDKNDWLPWFIDIYVKDRDELMKYLRAHDIGTRKIYNSLHWESIYKEYINDDLYCNSEKLSTQGLWLPSYITLSDTEITFICDKIKEYYS